VLVHLNGRLVDETAAVVSVFDRGFLFGDAVFESMRALDGRIFRLDRHLARLERSADLVGITGMPARADLARAVEELLEANRLRDARLRLTVSRGRGRPGDYVGSEGPLTQVISASPFSGPDLALFDTGVPIVVAPRRAVPAEVLDPAIKSTSRIVAVLARREARDCGAFEAIFLDAAGHLTEGTASNLFLVRDRRLLTPASPGGALPGVTRAAVIEVAGEAGLAVIEDRLPADLLPAADEIFLTNTSWEVLPVAAVDGRRVAGSCPGPITRDLLGRYRALVARECASA
jgi:branched-chain amino acid aminotransferase